MPGCGAPFTVAHALDCRVGGLVGWRYNEVSDPLSFGGHFFGLESGSYAESLLLRNLL